MVESYILMSGFQLLIFWQKSATKELVIQETEFKDEKKTNKSTLECQGQHEILYNITKRLSCTCIFRLLPLLLLSQLWTLTSVIH